jgi:hypothetical protein
MIFAAMQDRFARKVLMARGYAGTSRAHGGDDAVDCDQPVVVKGL